MTTLRSISTTMPGRRTAVAFLLLLTSQCALRVAGAKDAAEKRRYLILGGTGIRSYPTTEMFLQKGHDVVLLNRGIPYWDVHERLLKPGKVTHWKCDREEKLQNCKPLIDDLGTFEACIDFSSRKWEGIDNARTYLNDKCGFYIFVSSFKVYDVSGAIPKLTKKFMHNKGIKEDMMRRPSKAVSPLERHEIIAANPIADATFQVEEGLEKNYNSHNGWPYAILRVGNMLGGREAIMRLWFLQLWLHGHQTLGMPMHTTSTLPMSFTYSYDIAQAVAKIVTMTRNETLKEEITGEAFNIACEEIKDQYSLYYAIGDVIGLPKIEHITNPNRTESIVMFPENKEGHTMNIEKAKQVLKFKPTNLEKAIRESARFYEQAMKGEKWAIQRKIVLGHIASMMGTRRLVDWVEKRFLEKKGLYDEYDEEEYEEELEEKFRRVEL
ncbi:unnamed protein product [Amoebophrya sp. A25]|nr:unnamed protein product [Amoebophrya sp. A25]|eukprot:GSA25T00008953001.1